MRDVCVSLVELYAYRAEGSLRFFSALSFLLNHLRSARPPTQFARSVFLRSLHSRSVLRQRHANAHTLGGGTKGPKDRAPGGGAGGRALRARTGGRARCARWGPLGSQGDRLYATKAMPNGIDNTDERYSVNVSRFPPVWIPYGIAFVGITCFVQKLPICMRPK